MTKKYERQCWYCNARDMEDMGTYVRCLSCGATWNEVKSPGVAPITEIDVETGKSPRPGRATRLRPHGRAALSAARARGKR